MEWGGIGPGACERGNENRVGETGRGGPEITHGFGLTRLNKELVNINCADPLYDKPALASAFIIAKRFLRLTKASFLEIAVPSKHSLLTIGS